MAQQREIGDLKLELQSYKQENADLTACKLVNNVLTAELESCKREHTKLGEQNRALKENMRKAVGCLTGGGMAAKATSKVLRRRNPGGGKGLEPYNNYIRKQGSKQGHLKTVLHDLCATLKTTDRIGVTFRSRAQALLWKEIGVHDPDTILSENKIVRKLYSLYTKFFDKYKVEKAVKVKFPAPDAAEEKGKTRSELQPVHQEEDTALRVGNASDLSYPLTPGSPSPRGSREGGTVDGGHETHSDSGESSDTESSSGESSSGGSSSGDSDSDGD